MKRFFKFLISKVFLINVAIAIVLGAGILLGFYQWLKEYTYHNESLSVPDLKGMKVQKAEEVLEKRDLNHVVADSVYIPDKPELNVVEQQPKALSKVKVNRKIYLTINSPDPPKKIVPDLKDVSLRQALKILKTKGFKVGDLKYVPGLGKNTVKRLENNGKKIEPGTKIAKGTKINLVLAKGRNSGKTEIPNLKGLTRNDASFYLKGKGLNFGAILYDDEVKDSASAIIYKQSPLYKPDKKIPKGEIIDVWLTTEDRFEKLNMPDTSIKEDESIPSAWD